MTAALVARGPHGPTRRLRNGTARRSRSSSARRCWCSDPRWQESRRCSERSPGLLPSDGEIALGGTALWAHGSVVVEAQRQMGVVFQSEALFDSLSVLENVALPLLRRGATRDAATSRARECLREVSLSDAEAKLPEQLSGGMRKRVAMARAFAPRSPVLLIDDPLAGPRSGHHHAHRDAARAGPRRGARAGRVYRGSDTTLGARHLGAGARRGAHRRRGHPGEVRERSALGCSRPHDRRR